MAYSESRGSAFCVCYVYSRFLPIPRQRYLSPFQHFRSHFLSCIAISIHARALFDRVSSRYPENGIRNRDYVAREGRFNFAVLLRVTMTGCRNIRKKYGTCSSPRQIPGLVCCGAVTSDRPNADYTTVRSKITQGQELLLFALSNYYLDTLDSFLKTHADYIVVVFIIR